MEVVFTYIVEQIGVNGIFFGFTVVLAYLFYIEKKEDKIEFRKREKDLTNEIKKNQDLLKMFAEKYDIITERLDRIQEQINRKE